MDWDISNKAHTTVYSVAAYFRRKRAGRNYTFIPFKDAGAWSVSQLRDQTVNESAAIGKLKAEKAAVIYDEFFTNLHGATMHESIEKIDAINAMATCLSNDSNTITDLANVADQQYIFFGESS
jgi:hypothetical protein